MKTTFAACLVTILALASTARAQIGVTWNPGGPSPGLWSDAGNWGGSVPISGYKAYLNIASVGPCIVDSVAGGCQLAIANGGGPSTLIVTNGGDLTAGDTNGDIHNIGWTQLGGTGTGTMIVENGGNVKFMLHLWIGQDPGGVGTLIMNGGTASITNHPDGNWQLGSGGTGYINMNGGTLFLLKWDGTNQVKGASHIDVGGGKIIVNGDKTSIINELHASGKISAYGGTGILNVDYNVSNPGKTTISATSGVTCPVISTFDNFNLDGLFGWSDAIIVSGPTSYQVTDTGYGSGYKDINPNINGSGATTLELDVTLSGPPEADGLLGPIVKLVDGDGTEADYAWYGQTLGHHVLTKALNAGNITAAGTVPGLDLATLDFFHLQLDPSSFAGQYTVEWNNLALTGCTAAPPRQHIKSIDVSGGNVTIKYETTSGATYHLESSSTLLPGSWSTVSGSTVSASGTEETFSFPIPGNAPTFFRTSSP